MLVEVIETGNAEVAEVETAAWRAFAAGREFEAIHSTISAELPGNQRPRLAKMRIEKGGSRRDPFHREIRPKRRRDPGGHFRQCSPRLFSRASVRWEKDMKRSSSTFRYRAP